MKKIKLIFISTLMLILILSTISFASLDFTTEEAQNIIDFMISKETESNILEIYENVDINAFKDFLNNSSFTNVTSKNQLILYYSDNNNLLRIATTNASIGNELENVQIYYNNTNGTYQVKFINGGKSLRISGTTNFSYPYNHSAGYLLNIGTDTAEINYSNSTVTIEKLRACSNVTPIEFKEKDGIDFEWLFLRPSITPEIIYPPIGSGDNNGDSPSGDTGGGTTPDYSDDLDNIQTGISDINNNLGNIQESIPTSGEIAGATIEANKDFWGNTEEIKEEDFENEIKNEINNIIDTMSGEISQNQIFSELQSIENGFLNFFDKNQDEKFYDLAFEWDNIELYDTTLIPEGKINISQMCRDIETLGYIQTLTRTLFCFGTCVLIIKQIYNLILSTLGIDNPYLYEDPNTEHISYAYDVNTSTGQMRETTFYRKGNRTYRYHK